MLARRICSSVVLPLFLAVSCVEKIVLDPMEEMPVVVNCVLMTERTTQELDLYYAKRPSETAYVPITDAKVVVRDASGNSYPFQWNGERWTSDFVPVYKTRYFLEIETRDGEKLSAETTVPDNFLLVGTPLYEDCLPKSKSSGGHFIQVYSPKNLFLFGKNAPDRLSGFEPYNGELFAWITAGARLSTDHVDADPFNILSGTWDDLQHHPSPFVNYLNHPSNYISHLPIYKGFIRIHQMSPFIGTIWDPFIFFLDSDPENPGMKEDGSPEKNEYHVRFLSKEYDAYFKDIVNNKYVHSDELAQFYSMEPVSCNINGGLGVFGAETVSSVSFYKEGY